MKSLLQLDLFAFKAGARRFAMRLTRGGWATAHGDAGGECKVPVAGSKTPTAATERQRTLREQQN